MVQNYTVIDILVDWFYIFLFFGITALVAFIILMSLYVFSPRVEKFFDGLTNNE